MSHIFISYSRKDKAAATRLHAALSARSCDVWIDWEDIPPTATWWSEVEAAIEAADAVLLLISPDSVSSKVCAKEISVAESLNKRLLPMVVRDVDASKVPPAAAALNWIFMREGDPFDVTVETLLTAIDTDLDWVRDHTRLLVRAGEWHRHGKETSYLLRGADLDAARRWRAHADGKQPPPAPLHDAYLDASGAAEAVEIERLQALYRNALARQLAAQAALMQHENDAMLDRSMLLAAESMRRVPSAEADRVLRDGLRLRAPQVAAWQQRGTPRHLAVSTCGRWVVSGGQTEDEVVIRDNADGRIRRRILLGAALGGALFLPGVDALIVLAGSSLRLLDVHGEASPRPLGDHPGRVRSMCALPGADAVISVGEGGAVCHAVDGSGTRWAFPMEAEAWVAAADASGHLVAVGANDCKVRILDAATGAMQREFAHDPERPVMLLERGASDAGISALAFDGEPLRLLSAGLDGTVRLWDPATGVEQGRGSHGRDVLCAALHGGRGLVASGGLDCQLRFWATGGGAALTPIAFVPHQAAVTAVAWSADGRWLVSACGDGCARLWQVGDDGRPQEIARAVLPEWVGAAQFAGDHQIAADDGGNVVLFRIGAPPDRGVNHDYMIKGAACSDDGRHVLVRLDAPNMILYDAENGWSWKLLELPDFGDAYWFTGDNTIITTCWDGGVREQDVATLEVRCLQQHGARVWKAQAAHDGVRLLTAVQGEACARLWRRGATEADLVLPHPAQVRAADFSPDDTLLATGSDDGSVHVWTLADGAQRWRATHRGIVWSVAFDTSGRRVASVADDGDLVLRDALHGEELQRLPQPGVPDELAFSPDGRWLALRFSFRGPHIVRIWELPEMRLHAEFGHDVQVTTIVWNAEGTLLATGSDGGMVRVIDVARRHELVRLPFGRWCGSVHFIPQTQELLTASLDGKLRITCVDPLKMVRMAEGRVPRDLTNAEWAQYLPDEKRTKD
jgi:WD40 repeat protein